MSETIFGREKIQAAFSEFMLVEPLPTNLTLRRRLGAWHPHQPRFAEKKAFLEKQSADHRLHKAFRLRFPGRAKAADP